MPFNQKPQKFNAKINTVTVGTGDKAVTIGGNSTFPFYTFDAPTENRPKIGVEITDMGLDEFAPGIKAPAGASPLINKIARQAVTSRKIFPFTLCFIESLFNSLSLTHGLHLWYNL